MPRTATTIPLALPARDTRTAAYRWLYQEIRAGILNGRFQPGMQLPGTRDLALQYGLSRGTVLIAFDHLREEGYIIGTVGSGTRVSGTLPEDYLTVPGRAASTAPGTTRRARLSEYARQIALLGTLEVRPTRAFRANLPALDKFPMKLWTRLSSRHLKRRGIDHLIGCEPMGYLPLREALAAHLRASRGARCTASQIMIVSGTQEALDLSARILLDPGDHACMEDPGYPGAAAVMTALGARIVTARTDEEGMVLQPRAMKDVRLVYTTPAHQFPCSVTMSLSRRMGLLDWAQRQGAFIFEDDHDSEFRYSGRPVPVMQGLDRHNAVLLAGNFSKVLFPSLRLGYLVVPEGLVSTFAAAKSIASRHTPLLEQMVLCDFLTDGHYGRHIRRMREIYGERSAALMNAAGRHLGGLLTLSPVEAGLQTVGWLESGIDGEAAARAAALRHVEVNPLRVYARKPLQRDGLQLGFAAVNVYEINRGVRDLAAALEGLAKRRLIQ
jgi:GntR family transcriptional regulator / MocR family aminotransferase